MTSVQPNFNVMREFFECLLEGWKIGDLNSTIVITNGKHRKVTRFYSAEFDDKPLLFVIQQLEVMRECLMVLFSGDEALAEAALVKVLDLMRQRALDIPTGNA